MGGGGTPFLATNLGCLPTSVALSREEGAQSITWHGGEETSTYPASQSGKTPMPHMSSWGRGELHQATPSTWAVGLKLDKWLLWHSCLRRQALVS